jgi:prepilin-type N-terminal cleavage/methylation domain-containing protein
MDKKYSARRFSKAFTLLELLFVIVILAGLMLSWVLYAQRSTAQKMVDKTAEQMLNLIAASRSYFVGELYYWPSSLTVLESAGYLTGVEHCSSWQTIAFSDAQCANGRREAYQPYWSDTTDITKTKLFGVSLTVSDEKTANQIATRLPMRTVESSGAYWKVTALTTVPEVASDLKGKILKIGTVMSNQEHNNRKTVRSAWTKPVGNPTQDAEHGYVKKPNCPAPLVPAIYFTAYDFLLAHVKATTGGAGAPIRSVDIWCETGVKDPHDPTQLSLGFESYVPSADGKYCGDGGGSVESYPAYAGPQYCDYEPTLDKYPDYWRLNYWACRNSGPTTVDGDKASLIYFVTCLNPNSQFFYPFAPANDTVSPYPPVNDQRSTTDGNSYYLNKAALCKVGNFDSPNEQIDYLGCPYPTGCAYKNSTQSGGGEFCKDKRRRCINPVNRATHPSSSGDTDPPPPVLPCIRK